jgi:hypothetical protein
MAPESVPESATERRTRRATTKRPKRRRQATLVEYDAIAEARDAYDEGGYDVLPGECA